MREGVRTGILFLLLVIAVGFIWWTQEAYNDNFLQTLE